MLCVHGSDCSRDSASTQADIPAVDVPIYFAIQETMKPRISYSASEYQEELREYIIQTVKAEWRNFSEFSREAFPDRKSAPGSFRALRNSGQHINIEYLVKIANAFQMTPAQILADVEALFRQKQKNQLALAAETPESYNEGNARSG